MTFRQDLRPRPQEAGTATSADLERLARVVRSSLGIDLQPAKSSVVRHRLGARMRELGLSSLGAYLDLIEAPWAEDERDKLISATTTNVTHFFREAHHFDMFERDVLPGLIEQAKAGGRVRIWSAGCSTGQEPFSVAACIVGLCPEAAQFDIRVLATDVDQGVLEQARDATYPVAEADLLPPERRRALFGESTHAGSAKIRDAVLGLVSFKRLNLVKTWPMKHPFDVIFCRNVAIYLDKTVREDLWRRFTDALRDGGVLFIGHSERVLGSAIERLDHAGTTAYRKRPAPRPSSSRI